MKEIIISKKYVALVDNEDYERVNAIKWLVAKQKNTYYARHIICVNRKQVKTIYLHRFVLGIEDSSIFIDHKDRNGLNNTKNNLRVASHSDNIKNRGKHRGTSKYTGVNKHLYGKWLARININGKQKHLGCFDSEIEAAKAYNIAAIATGNTFYNLNDI